MPKHGSDQGYQLLVSVALLAGLFLFCTSCGTTTPLHPSTVASFDGNEQNSGILEFCEDGIVVTSGARDTYNSLIEKVGSRLIPPMIKDFGVTPLPDGNFKMTYSAFDKWNRMKLMYELAPPK